MNIGYLFVWIILILVSSYPRILHDCGIGYIIRWEEETYTLVVPLIIWLVAFFIDFVWKSLVKEATEFIEAKSIMIGTGAVSFFLFFLAGILAQSADTKESLCYCYYSRDVLRAMMLVGMFLCVCVLKLSSITSLNYKEEVKSV